MLPRQMKPCEICGSEDYAHGHQVEGGDEVRWLCRAHHDQWHAAHGRSFHWSAPNGGVTPFFGDIVSPRIRLPLPSDPQVLINQPPVFGIVDAVTTSGGCIPVVTSINVLWANLTYFQSGTITKVDDANLDLILKATSLVTSTFLGRWVRRITGTNTQVDKSGGTSREFDGKVVAIYQRQPLEDSTAPAIDYLLVECDDGTFIEDVASRFVVDTNR